MATDTRRRRDSVLSRTTWKASSTRDRVRELIVCVGTAAERIQGGWLDAVAKYVGLGFQPGFVVAPGEVTIIVDLSVTRPAA